MAMKKTPAERRVDDRRSWLSRLSLASTSESSSPPARPSMSALDLKDFNGPHGRREYRRRGSRLAQVQAACEAPLAEGVPIESGNAHALAAKRRG